MNHYTPDLTMRAKENLYGKDNGYGVLFVKIGENEMQIIEFNLGKNDKFYTMNKTELTKRVTELSKKIGEGYK